VPSQALYQCSVLSCGGVRAHTVRTATLHQVLRLHRMLSTSKAMRCHCGRQYLRVCQMATPASAHCRTSVRACVAAIMNSQLTRGPASATQCNGSVGEESHQRYTTFQVFWEEEGVPHIYIISFRMAEVAVHLQIQSHGKLGGPLTVVELALLDARERRRKQHSQLMLAH